MGLSRVLRRNCRDRRRPARSSRLRTRRDPGRLLRQPPAMRNGYDLLMCEFIESYLHPQLAAPGFDPDVIVFLDAELLRRLRVHFGDWLHVERAQ